MKPQKHYPHIINEAIRGNQIMLLDATKQPIGVTTVQQALIQAKQAALDLVLIAPKANPPVCMVADYGKFLYEHNKHNHAHKAPKLKEVQLSMNIDPHDLAIKVSHAAEFLDGGHGVKVILQLKGREKAHPELGRVQVEKFIQSLCPNKPVKIQAHGSSFHAYVN